ncbi:serine hydroxymethyltransferase [Candidatus Endobugula sertula]|uniref:Probable serine hydroxymethyltransferase n=1 Tax=Candidatus Endobugula sertula TaxID=62101 RepID=A0A1D2QR84_9GAMM|nr:serine hydroxymethyltransferase [Candidatus Endobugula sertula]
MKFWQTVGKHSNSVLSKTDPEIFSIVDRENLRKNNTIELIASANTVSPAVLEAMGSELINKVVEGYIGQRYFSGCTEIDKLENLAIHRAKQVFGATYANVQPHSCSQANQSVHLALMKPGDSFLGMDLMHGGHLSHGARTTLTAHHYTSLSYPVSREDEYLDYDQILKQAKEVRPKLIIAGASAYSRTIDFKRFRDIADQVGAFLLVDMAHIAGLVAAGLHPSPIAHAHIVTSSTQKTLRGPRGGIALMGKETANEYGHKLDSAIFPGLQGAAHMHTIAAKAVALEEALQPDFVVYQQNVLDNAKTLAEALMQSGFRLVSGGTDNHLMILDLRSQGMTGKEAEERLENVGITVNKNLIPYDLQKPWICSGIRIGTAAVTTRGFGPTEMHAIATMLDKILNKKLTAQIIQEVRHQVSIICRHHPLHIEEDIDNEHSYRA